MNDEQGAAAGWLAGQAQWHERAIYAMAEFGQMGALAQRFPQGFAPEFIAAADSYDLPLSWLYAIARRESAYNPEARSRANAYGLMQILPDTASYLAKRPIRSSKLKQPKYSTEFGAQYLAYLANRLSPHPVLRTAAYNAGWRRVESWLPQHEMPLDIWIETIPYKETREYTQAVIAYEHIYAHQLQVESAFWEPWRAPYVSVDDLSATPSRASLSAQP